MLQENLAQSIKTWGIFEYFLSTMILGTMRIESYLHLHPEQHFFSTSVPLWKKTGVVFAYTSPKAHTLLIFRCMVEELWFCL